MKKTHIIYILLLLMAMASIFPGQVAYAAEGDATVGTSDYTWSIPSEITLGTTSEVSITPNQVFVAGSTITMDVSAADGFVLQLDYGGTETSKIGYEIRKGASEDADIITADNKTALIYTADGSTTITATQQLSFVVTDMTEAKVSGKHIGAVTFDISADIIQIISGATFDRILKCSDISTHTSMSDHYSVDACWESLPSPVTLTWEELKNTTNGTTYGYDASALSDDTIIGIQAFQYCKGLVSITIPSSVTSIGNYAFSWCSNLTSVTYIGTQEQWGTITKGTDWNSNTGDYAIHCSDKCINKSEEEIFCPLHCNFEEQVTGSTYEWTNTSNGTPYCFTQDGYKWTSNNKGIHSSTATSTWTVEVPEEILYDLKYYVSSEGRSRDYLSVTLNDKRQFKEGGTSYTSDLTTAITLKAGTNTITATYIKDSSIDKGSDMGYLILDPANNIVKTHTCTYHKDSHLADYQAIPETNTATCTSEGEITYKCNKCNISYIGPSPTLPHNYVFEENILKCASCGEEASGYAVFNSVSPVALTWEELISGKDSSIYGYDASKITYYSIEAYAFNSCSKLISITIPNSVTSIRDSAFYYCGSLKSVEIPDSVTSIGDSAFFFCESLTSITIPNSVTSIGDYAFEYCKNLSSVTIGNNVQSIGDSAFAICDSLSSVTIGNSVTSIGRSAFWNCTKLTSIAIPDSVTNIGTSAFLSCSSLTEINVNENNPNYSSVDGILFNKDKATLIQYPAGKTNTNYTIPASVQSIGEYAFNSCRNLSSVTIGNSVTSIGNYAFHGCSSLTSITIPDSVTSIGNDAFLYCRNLSSVTIGNSVQNIGNNAFEYCDILVNIIIPSSVTSIGEEAFEDCKSLTSINVEVNNIAYKDIDGVLFTKDGTILHTYPAGKTDTSYTIPDSVQSIGNYAFKSCTSLIDITIQNSVQSIGEYAFSDCNKLNSITIPDSVTSIGEYAFSSCSNLSSVTIGNSVTSIGNCAFQYCNKLTSITIPGSVQNIGNYTFRSCTNLTNITYNGTQSQWDTITKGISWNDGTGDYTIHCTDACLDSSNTKITCSTHGDNGTGTTLSLQDPISTDEETIVDIPDNTEITLDIDSNTKIATFQNEDESKTTLTWGDLQLQENAEKYGYGTLSEQLISGTTIEYAAFAECTSLKEIVIPYGITNIGECAFWGCTNLTSIILPNTIEEIEANAFDSCSSLVNITFAGTASEWDAITKGEDWNYEINSDYTLHCDDSCINSEGAVIECSLHSSSDVDNTQSDSNEFVSDDSGNTDTTTSDNQNNTETPIDSNNASNAVDTPDNTSSDKTDTSPSDDTAITDSTDAGSDSTTTDNTVTSPEPDASGNPSDTTTDTETEEPFEIDINFEMATFQSVDTETEEKISTVVTWFGLQQPENRELYGYSETLVNDTNIEASAFFECEPLTEFVIPDGITSIGTAAFYNCTNLTSITIPESVTEIGENALYGCNNLQIIYFTGSQSQWDSIIKGENWNYDVKSTYLIHCNDVCLDNSGNVVEIPSHFQNTANTTESSETETSSETVQTETETDDNTVPADDNTTKTDITEELGSVVLNDATDSTETDTQSSDETEVNNTSDSSLDSDTNENNSSIFLG